MANLHDTVVQVSHARTCAAGAAAPVWLPSQVDGVRLVEDVENCVGLRVWVRRHPLYEIRPPLRPSGHVMTEEGRKSYRALA